jgi:hypothetical protein
VNQLAPIELEKVLRLAPRAAVARTFKSAFVRGAVDITSLFRPSRHVPETLRTTDGTYQEELDEADSYIKRGDPVVQVVGDEFLNE